MLNVKRLHCQNNDKVSEMEVLQLNIEVQVKIRILAYKI